MDRRSFLSSQPAPFTFNRQVAQRALIVLVCAAAVVSLRFIAADHWEFARGVLEGAALVFGIVIVGKWIEKPGREG